MSGKQKLILRLSGTVLLVLGISMIIPMLIGVYNHEKASVTALAEVILACLVIGMPLRLLKIPQGTALKSRDGFLLVTLIWFFTSVIGAFPFVLSGEIPSFADAFFEMCSGFSTTGATILTDIEAMSRSLLFWRSLTHWLGGMGIVVFIMIFIPSLGASNQNVAYAETTGPVKGKVTARFSDTARTLYGVYIIFTMVQIVLLILGGASLYDSCILTFGTVGTGGFANYGDSIAGFNPYIQIVITVFMILAGLNFSLYISMQARGIKAITKNEEAVFYFRIIAAASLLIFLINSISDGFRSIGRTLLDSVFQVASIITTTGYATCDYDTWPVASRFIIFTLFFIGGCAGSTAGGIKCVRVLTGFKLIHRGFSVRIHPNRIAHITMDGVEVANETVIRITNFLIMYVTLLFAGTLVVSLDNFDLITTFSSVATCLGNIGPGYNLVGPSMNFSLFSDFSKYVLSFLMIVGRLEIFTVMVLFSRHYWNPNLTK